MKEMTAEKRNDSREEISSTVLEIGEWLRDNKARDIIILDLRGKTSITDYFIICTVNSVVQTRALVRSLSEFMNRINLKPLSKDSRLESPWVLLDYNDFVIHIFLQQGRDYYRLEKLWIDAKVVYSHEGEII